MTTLEKFKEVFKGKTATRVYKDGDFINVQYHDTVVFKYNTLIKEIVLNTDGWLTDTTKKRINDALNTLDLNIKIKQVKGVWYLNEYLYSDNMRIPTHI